MNFIIKWVIIITIIIIGYLIFTNYVYPMLSNYYSSDKIESQTNYPPGHPSYTTKSYEGNSSWNNKLGINDQTFNEAAEFVANNTPGYYGWLAKLGLIIKNGGKTQQKLEGNIDPKSSQSIENDCTDDISTFNHKNYATKTIKRKLEAYKRNSIKETESMFIRMTGLEAIRELVVKFGGDINKNYKEDVLLDVSDGISKDYIFVDAVLVGSGNSFGLKFRNYSSTEFPNSKHKSLEEFKYYRNIELNEIENAIASGLYLIEIPWNVYMYEFEEDVNTGEIVPLVNKTSELNKAIKNDPKRHETIISERFLHYIQYHLNAGYKEFLSDENRNPYPKFYN